MYSAFVLIIPPRLGDIQAARVPQLGFGRRVISGPLGSVYNIRQYRTRSEGGWRRDGCRSLAPVWQGCLVPLADYVGE